MSEVVGIKNRVTLRGTWKDGMKESSIWNLNMQEGVKCERDMLLMD